MMATARTLDVNGLKVGICVQPVKSGLTMLANLVDRCKEFKGLDVAVGVFPTDLDSKCMIIGRSKPQGVNIGHVMRKLGGGGHTGAGSAVIKGMSSGNITETLMELIRNAVEKDILVGDIMSHQEPFRVESTLTMARARDILQAQRVNAVMICEDTKFLGTLSGLDIAKAERSRRMETSVKGYMKRHVSTVTPHHNARHALELMNQSQDGILPVIEDERLVGVLTRGDLLLQIYDT